MRRSWGVPLPDLVNSPLWPADNPAVIAHLNMLQGIITRLANNSASCKTWCLTLVGALVSLAGATHQPGIVQFAAVPVIIFAFLDTRYLAQERAYRALFNSRVELVQQRTYTIGGAFSAEAATDFVDTVSAFFSWSVAPVYLALIAMYLIAVVSGWVNALAVVVPKAT